MARVKQVARRKTDRFHEETLKQILTKKRKCEENVEGSSNSSKKQKKSPVTATKKKDVKIKQKTKKKKVFDNKPTFKFTQSMYENVDFCSTPKKVMEFIAKATPKQREEIFEMGFRALLNLKVKEFNRGLYPLLMASYDSMVLQLRNGSSIHAGSEFFYETLGLPTKNRKIFGKNGVQCAGFPVLPLQAMKGSLKQEKDEIFNKWRAFLNMKKENRYVSAENVIKKLNEMPDGGDDFKKLFVLFAMSNFLAPNSSKSMLLDITYALENVQNIKDYDWSSFMAQSLNQEVMKVKNKVRKLLTDDPSYPQEKITLKVGGCFPALMIGYFHNYVFGDNLPDTIHFMHHWVDKSVSKRVRSELKNPCVGAVRLPILKKKFKEDDLHGFEFENTDKVISEEAEQAKTSENAVHEELLHYCQDLNEVLLTKKEKLQKLAEKSMIVTMNSEEGTSESNGNQVSNFIKSLKNKLSSTLTLLKDFKENKFGNEQEDNQSSLSESDAEEEEDDDE